MASNSADALISVVVPVYNVERYLPRCAASIQTQTYSNLEIVLVDDGSTDSCPSVCDAIAREDARVKVIHKQNGGLASARKAGLTAVSGEYVGFVDGDDMIEPDMYRELLETLGRTRADIAMCGITIDRDGDVFPMPLPERFWKNNNYELSGDAALAAMLRQDIGISVCDKLYTRRIIGDITFDESARVLEDMPFNFEILSKGAKVAYLPRPMYVYMQRDGSNSRLGANAAFKLEVRLRVLERLAEQSDRMSKPVRLAAREFCCRNVFHAVIMMGADKRVRREVRALMAFAWRQWRLGVVPPVASLAWEMAAREAVRVQAREVRKKQRRLTEPGHLQK